MAEGLLKANWPENQFLFGSSSKLSSYSREESQQNSKDSQNELNLDQQFLTKSNELLDSIFELCKDIQNKAFHNVKTTTNIMQKFKAIKAFKEYIDWQWSQIQKITKEFLINDEYLVKQFTQVKNQARRISQQVQICQNVNDIELLSRDMQNSSIFIFANNKLEFSQIENRKLEQKIRKWKNNKRQILKSLQIMQQYAVKIVEAIIDQDEQDANCLKKNDSITKVYFSLRDEIHQILDAKLYQSSRKTLENTGILESSLDTFENECNQLEQYQTGQADKIVTSQIINRILDLYKDIEL